TIVYQKPNAKDVPLRQRTNYYNEKNVDLVFSIHANASGDASVNGRCVFYWGTSEKSKRLAEIIVSNIKKAGYSTHGNGLHAGVRGSWTNLHINRETKMPAVLVENGFMTGNKDFDLIFGSKQNEYIEDMAEVPARSVAEYFGISSESKPSKPASKPSKKPAPTKPSKPSYKANLAVDGKWGEGTTKALQKALGTPSDGILSGQLRNNVTEALYGNTAKFGGGGSVVIRALQRKLGVKADGLLGPATVKALQKRLGTKQDGKLSRPSLAVKEMQRRLNAGTFLK